MKKIVLKPAVIIALINNIEPRNNFSVLPLLANIAAIKGENIVKIAAMPAKYPPDITAAKTSLCGCEKA